MISTSIRVFLFVLHVCLFFQQDIPRLYGVNIGPASKIGHQHCCKYNDDGEMNCLGVLTARDLKISVD